jgi:hypothetical protein
VYQAERVLLDINLQILPTRDVDLQSLTQTIIGIVNNYLGSLGLGSPFIKTDLLNKVQVLTGVAAVSLVLPTQDVSPSPFQVVRSNKVWVTYETS